MKHIRPSMNLDEILHEKWSPGDVIELRDGVYTTQGSKDGACFIPPGVTLDVRKAKLVLENPILGSNPWIELPLLDPGVEIVGGDWDLGDHGGIAQSGFRALGTCRITGGTKLKGLLGRRVAMEKFPQKEVFAFCQPGGGTGGTEISDFTATVLRDDPDNYSSGVYVYDKNAKVARTRMNLGKCGQFAYSCAQSTEFIEGMGEAARFAYTDTKGFQGVFRDCKGRAHWAAFAFAGSGEKLAERRDLVAIECQIDASGGRVVEFDDSQGPQDASVTLFGGRYIGAYRLASTSKRSRMVAYKSEIMAEQDYRPSGEPEPIIV